MNQLLDYPHHFQMSVWAKAMPLIVFLKKSFLVNWTF